MSHQALIGKTMSTKLVIRCGDSIEWVTSCRYFGVILTSEPRFKCRFDDEKAQFYGAFNAIMGKVGRIASQEVIPTLVNYKCAPTLLYFLEDCPLHTMDIKLNLRILQNILN